MGPPSAFLRVDDHKFYIEARPIWDGRLWSALSELASREGCGVYIDVQGDSVKIDLKSCGGPYPFIFKAVPRIKRPPGMGLGTYECSFDGGYLLCTKVPFI